MKNLISTSILLLLMLTVNVSAQVNLKGIELGSKTKIEGKEMSLVGHPYYFFTTNLNDGTCSSIFALPLDGANVRRVSSSELLKLKGAIESKFNVKMRFLPKNQYIKEEGWYHGEKNGVRFTIVVKDHNEFMDYPYDISFFVSDLYLSEIYDEEQQAKANKDI